ncbi:hypothetical protein LCGC14_1688870, partial [marine sediment metagenome]
IGRPVAGLLLRGDIPQGFEPAPPKPGFQFGSRVADPIETGTGLAGQVRVGEIVFGETTGIETTAVSGALRSQLAEDVLSEAINPVYLAMAFPFVGVGLKGLTGAARVLRIAANLTIGTDAGAARGFPLLRPDKLRAVLRGLSAVAKSPTALTRLPKAVRANPVFQRGFRNIQEARGADVNWFGTPLTPKLGDDTERLLSQSRRGAISFSDNDIRAIARAEGIDPSGLTRDGILQELNNKQYLKNIRADDPTVLKQVLDDMAVGRKVDPKYIPLQQAIKADLTAGRSVGSIIKKGVTPRGSTAVFTDRVTVFHGTTSLDEAEIVAQGLRPGTALVTDRGVAEGFAATRATASGGEPRVFSFQVDKAFLKNPGGRPSYYFVSDKFELVSGVSRHMDDAFSPGMRALVQTERTGDKVRFSTIRSHLWDEIREIETSMKAGTAGALDEVRRMELRSWLGFGMTEDGFRDVVRFMAESELGLSIPADATLDQVMTRIAEFVDTPISPGGVEKWWASEQGGGLLPDVAGAVRSIARKIPGFGGDAELAAIDTFRRSGNITSREITRVRSQISGRLTLVGADELRVGLSTAGVGELSHIDSALLLWERTGRTGQDVFDLFDVGVSVEKLALPKTAGGKVTVGALREGLDQAAPHLQEFHAGLKHPQLVELVRESYKGAREAAVVLKQAVTAQSDLNASIIKVADRFAVSGKTTAETSDSIGKVTLGKSLGVGEQPALGDYLRFPSVRTALSKSLGRTVDQLTTEELETLLKASTEVTQTDMTTVLRTWETLQFSRALYKQQGNWESFILEIQAGGRGSKAVEAGEALGKGGRVTTTDAELSALSQVADTIEARKSAKPLTDLQKWVVEDMFPAADLPADVVRRANLTIQGYDSFATEKLTYAMMSRIKRGFAAGDRVTATAGELFDVLESIKNLKPGAKIPAEASNVLRRVFGDTKEGRRLHGLFNRRSNWEVIADIANIPRALRTTVDVSATFRQAFFTFARRPVTGVVDLMRSSRA